MKSFKVWREEVQTGAEDQEPNEQEWQFYHSNPAGQIKTYLMKLQGALEGHDMRLVKKGFILETVVDALGLGKADLNKLYQNIKRATMRRQQQMQVQGQAQANPTGTNGAASPATNQPFQPQA